MSLCAVFAQRAKISEGVQRHASHSPEMGVPGFDDVFIPSLIGTVTL
jgi:hypothetical protein